MKLQAKARLQAMRSMSFEKWRAEVLKLHKNAKFTYEDGSGPTYGDEGDWAAHTGPDMQADVIGAYSWQNDVCWIDDHGDFVEYGTEGTPVTGSLSDPTSDGVAFETLMDGADDAGTPLIQKLTNDDGGFEPAEEQPLLIDTLPI